MHVRLLQIIDYWVGVPLCFLMSCIHTVLKWVAPPSSPATPKNILFIELSEMGSAILAYSSLVQAQRKYPGSKLYFLIFAKNAESCALLKLLPKEQILTVDDRTFFQFTFSVLKILLQIHRLGIDTAIDLELFSRCTALITYLSGARRRIGFHRATNEGLYRGNLLSHPVPYNPHLHIALNFLALVSAIDAPAGQVPIVKADLSSELVELPLLKPSDSESSQIWELLTREASDITPQEWLFVFNPDPGDALPIRGWPLDRFISTAAKLLDEFPRARVVVIGLKRSRPYAEKLQAALGPERCLDLTGKTSSLQEVCTLLSVAKLLVSNDSGPAHMAALTGTPSVVLYGPETPSLYGPLSPLARSLFARYSCSPCLSALNHRHTRCNDNLCLKAISVDEVYAAALDALGIASHAERPSSLFVLNRYDRAA